MNVLFLFESILPDRYHAETTSPGELRVIAAQKKVDTVVALGRKGISFYDVESHKPVKTTLEKKINLLHFNWLNNPIAYYFCWLGLLWHGFMVLKKNKYEVIHAESPHISGIAAIILGKIFGIKVIVEYRVNYDELFIQRYGALLGSIIKRLFWIEAGLVMRNASFIMANSKTYELLLKNKLKINHVGHYNPGFRIPNDFTHIEHHGIIVGFIGRLYKDKGPIYFVELVNHGKSWFRKNNVHFLMAGDGPEKQVLHTFIKKNRIEDLVTILGTLDRWEFFKQIDIHINTTLVKSALEMTNAEASSMGIPTLAFGEDHFPETVIDGVNGYIIEVGNTLKMYKLLTGMVLDQEKFKSFSQKAVQHSRNYSFETQKYHLERMYTYI